MAFVAGTVLTAADLNSEFASKSDTAPAINAQTGTTYTFVLADATAGKTITASNAAASTYTVPPESSVTFVDGALLRVTNLGAGVVTFAGGVGVTVTNTAATLSQFQTATLVRTGSDAWTVIRQGASPGMDLINTTSLSGSAVSVNSVFTATYAHYFLTVDAVLGSSAFIQMRLRAAGSDSSTAIYDRQASTARSTVLAGNALATDTKINVTFSGGTGTNIVRLDVFNPQAALQTGVLVMGGQLAPEMGIGRYIYTATTSFDGFSLFPDTGTFTSGTVRTYGLRNS